MHPDRTGKRLVSIWFFIGVLLVIYGFLIIGQGMWEMFYPPTQPVVLAELRAGLWWGSLLIVLGAVYVGRFAPW
jgi:hypothetical protein